MPRNVIMSTNCKVLAGCLGGVGYESEPNCIIPETLKYILVYNAIVPSGCL